MARQTMRELEQSRASECRLTPDRALGDVEEAAAFLADRGMLTRMPDSALPSLFAACHEEPARAGGRGFDLWPKTKWIFSFQLTQRRGTVLTKMHRGKSLYLSTEAARAFDQLVRQSIDAAVGDDAMLLDHLARHGPSVHDDIQLELGWDRKRLKQVRVRLERVGAIVSEGLVFEDAANWYFAPMRRWDHLVRASRDAADPYAAVVLAGVKAAVITPETNLQSWFSWPIPDQTVNSLVKEGKLVRPAPGWLAAG